METAALSVALHSMRGMVELVIFNLLLLDLGVVRTGAVPPKIALYVTVCTASSCHTMASSAESFVLSII